MIFLSDHFKGVPQRFRDPSHFQGSSALVSNRGMRDPANAVRIMSVIASRASKTDLILFDEYHHGFEEQDRDGLREQAGEGGNVDLDRRRSAAVP